MKNNIDYRIHRREVLLHPALTDVFSKLSMLPDDNSLEIEFCDTLNRITSFVDEDDRTIIQFDLSGAESICLFYFALRDGYLSDYIEYLFYLIATEQAFICGKYSIADHFSKSLKTSYAKVNDLFTSHRQTMDWKVVLIIHIFIYTHEFGHYLCSKKCEYISTADKLITFLKIEAEKYLDEKGDGKEIANTCMDAPNMGEELICDYQAAVASKAFSDALSLDINIELITYILEAQGLISYITLISQLIVHSGKIQNVNTYDFYYVKLRSFFLNSYLGILCSVYKDAGIKSSKSDIDISTINNTYSRLVNNLLEQNKEIIAKLTAKDISAIKDNNKTITKAGKEQILNTLKEHITLFDTDENGYEFLGQL